MLNGSNGGVLVAAPFVLLLSYDVWLFSGLLFLFCVMEAVLCSCLPIHMIEIEI